MTSILAHKSGEFAWNDLNADNSYDRLGRYAASKLTNTLLFFEPDRHLRASVTALGASGFAATDPVIWAAADFTAVSQPVFELCRDGGWPTLQAATGPVTFGGYYEPIGFREIRGMSGDASRAAQAEDSALPQRL